MKVRLLFILLLTISSSLFAQNKSGKVKGRLIDRMTSTPIVGADIKIENQGATIKSDSKGQFVIDNLSAGSDFIIISNSDIQTLELPIQIGSEVLDLSDIFVFQVITPQNSVLNGVIDDAIIDDDGSTQDIKAKIITSNDIFLNLASFQLSPFRFNPRGYSNKYEDVYINGVKFNSQYRGGFNYSSIGALNDVTRLGDDVNYLEPSTFTYGAIAGSQNIDMRAASMARRGSVTASFTNRNYYLRGMATLSSGLMENGFAYTISVGGRYANEGLAAKGTSYKNFSYAILLEKQWDNGKQRLAFSTFGSPVERGQAGHSTEEVYKLVGDNLYNPNWGYQDGKKRNARMVRAFDPTAILSYEWKINDHAKLNAGYGMHYSYDRRTALNWYNGADPRPDYYRYLPVYYTSMSNPDAVADAAIAADMWRSKDSNITQINWNAMYEANRIGQRPNNGDPNSAIYMIEGRRTDMLEHNFNATMNLNWANNQSLTLGVQGGVSNVHLFKDVVDLLGSQYVIDTDKYAERDADGMDATADHNMMQNNLRNPNRKAYKGDTFGYDYNLNINSGQIWLQNEYKTRDIDAYYGVKTTFTNFSRKGKMQNGRYPTESYGRGDNHNFLDFGVKGGATYKISGREYITANVNIESKAPLADDAYISPRVWDGVVKDLKSTKVISADLSYIWSYPNFKGRVSLFQTYFFDGIKKTSYYDDTYRTYVHSIANCLNSSHRGIELAGSYKIDDHWSVDLASSIAQYKYINNPDATTYYENNTYPNGGGPETETVYVKNAHIGGVPQVAGTFKLNYFNNFWFLSASVNGIARNFVEISTTRRRASIYNLVDNPINPLIPEELAAYKLLTGQERMGSAYTIDFSLGKLLYLPNGESLSLNFTFNNILNRKNIKTGGYQQGRTRLNEPLTLANKYFYMQGFNCFLNASYRFKL